MTPLQNCAVASPSPGLGLRRPLLTENMTTTWICALRNGARWHGIIKNISLYTNSDLSYKRITLAHERGGRTSSRTRVRMRWTRAASAREAIAGRDDRERWASRVTNGAGAYGKSVWSWLSLLQSSFRGDASAQPGLFVSPIREATEARTNSSPGRARHKPSNHCAGKAGLSRLPCVSPVHCLRNVQHRGHGRQPAPGLPCALCYQGG